MVSIRRTVVHGYSMSGVRMSSELLLKIYLKAKERPLAKPVRKHYNVATYG